MTPLTLSEFLDSLDRSAVRAYDAEGEETPVSDVVRPLVLRLLAGERERAASLSRADVHTAAGLALYDTRTHAIVPRRLTRRMALAIDVAPLADDVSVEEAWQPTWDAGIAAAEAERRENGDGS